MKYSKVGIDVSEWQADINYRKAVNSGVEFAIIRSSYGWKSESQKDKFFDRNMSGFQSLGIPCGVYHYSYAVTTDEAKAEAEFCLKCINDFTPNLPIYYDMEEETQAALGKELCTNIAEAFCAVIENAGYTAGVYASTNWFTNHLDFARLSQKYSIWLAQWSDKPSLNAQIWQYSSKGKVAGINGNVDMNYMLSDIEGGTDSSEALKDKTDELKLKKVNLYISSTSKYPAGTVSGTYWLWNSEKINGRVRITNAKSSIGKVGQVTGWINASDIGEKQLITYTVKPGDTLWGIAEKYLGSGTDYKKIMEYNGLKNEMIFAGQKLDILV